jgi:hypothetical protein
MLKSRMGRSLTTAWCAIRPSSSLCHPSLCEFWPEAFIYRQT